MEARGSIRLHCGASPQQRAHNRWFQCSGKGAPDHRESDTRTLSARLDRWRLEDLTPRISFVSPTRRRTETPLRPKVPVDRGGREARPRRKLTG